MSDGKKITCAYITVIYAKHSAVGDCDCRRNKLPKISTSP